MTSLVSDLFGVNVTIKGAYSLRDKVIGLFVLTRPALSLLSPINAASAAVLALGGYPPLLTCILGFICVALAAGGINTFNDFVDRERDKTVWPGRPIPSKRVSAGHALALALALFAGALVISWFFFNQNSYVNFTVLALAILLGGGYSMFFRDKVGYLSLPPINGLIYLGGWTAFAPETLFTSFLPWFLFLHGLVWQAAHIMVYSPVHPVSKSEGKLRTEKKALFFVPTPRLAAVLGMAFLVLTVAMNVLLPFLTPLGPVYLSVVALSSVFALIATAAFLKDLRSREKGIKAFASVSLLRLGISGAILLDVLLLIG
ncbi:MAG: UbiA prenyltransferase family protein [Chloroflexi bacterium]|nr:UbiA prenyltransferase family protein [Chloroflexota bacterium]